MASINLLYTKTHPKKVNVWVWLVNSESLTAYIALLHYIAYTEWPTYIAVRYLKSLLMHFGVIWSLTSWDLDGWMDTGQIGHTP